MKTFSPRNAILSLFAGAGALLAGVGCSAGDEELKAAVENLERKAAAAEEKLAALESRFEPIEQSEPVGLEKFQRVSHRLSQVEASNRHLDVRVESLETETFHKPQLEKIKALYPEAESTGGGLHYLVEAEGEGTDTPRRGDTVIAHYEGTLLDGSEFDSSYKRGEPFRFQVGMGRVIKGWDEAFLSMKKGEKRTLVIPSKLAYGAGEIPDSIPAHSILVFSVELIDWK